MTAAALSLALFDPERGRQVLGRAGATLIFEGARSRALDQGPSIEAAGTGWTARLEGELDVRLEPVARAAPLAGASVVLTRAEGEIGGRSASCLGVVTETLAAPDWRGLDVLRELALVVDDANALFVICSRPRGALGHGDERVEAALIAAGAAVAVRECRVSTVYDAGGRQQSAGLELWVEEEDFPRRASGVAVAGSTLELPGLIVNAAAFDWRFDGRSASGSYELTARAEDPVAA